MAAIVAFDLAGSGYVGSAYPLVYTFGAPRVGDRAFVSQYANRINSFRVVYNRDIVPHLPSPKLKNGCYKLLLRYGMEGEMQVKVYLVYMRNVINK